MRRLAYGMYTVVAVLLLIASGAVGVRAYHRACDGSLEGLRYLSNVRAQIQTATVRPPTPPTPQSTTAPTSGPAHAPPEPPSPPGPTAADRIREVAGNAGDLAIGALIQVKQHDAVAYPAHIVAAHSLDVAGCGKDAVRLQWLKAGLHASDDEQIEYVARSLVAGARDQHDLADLRRVVRTWTQRAPMSDSLRQVLAALDATGS